jgi:hypothetical protein
MLVLGGQPPATQVLGKVPPGTVQPGFDGSFRDAHDFPDLGAVQLLLVKQPEAVLIIVTQRIQGIL